jgi:PAS domain S-box-containing protein
MADLQGKWRNNIRLRHTVGLSIVILVIMSIGSAAMLYQQRAKIRQAAEERGLAFNRTFAVMGAAAVLNNLFRVQEAMDRIIQDPDIREIDIIDLTGMIVAAKPTKRIGKTLRDQDWITPPKSEREVVTYSADVEGEPLLVIVEPLFDDDGKIAAWTRVVFSLSQVRREEWQSIQRMILVTIALVVAGIAGVYMMQRKVAGVFRGIVGKLQDALTTIGIPQSQYSSVAAGLGESAQPLPADHGELEYLTTVVTRTTELLIRQSEVLRESEMKFRSVAQSANDAIVSADQRGDIIAWNTSAEHIFGYKEGEVFGKPLTMLMAPRYRAAHSQDLERMLRGSESALLGKTTEIVGLRKSGQELPLELSLSSWKTGQGTFYTGIIRDVTERKHAEEALRSLTASLEQKVLERTAELEVARDQALSANRHKSEFLANMSHELRTPLNAVIGFSEVLLEKMFGEINQKQEEYLRDILSSGRHLLALINDILDLAKIESGRLELDLSTFELPTVLNNAYALIRERAVRHGIHVSLDIDPRLWLFTADERKLKQILLNLLSNAIKFTPDGGTVLLKAVLQDDGVEVSVIDTGIGIEPEWHQKIFEEFIQVGHSLQKREGTGLGLALTRKFVELHRGRIWVQSAKGLGSTFTFTLPFTPTMKKHVAPTVAESDTSPNAPLALVIEDDPAAAELLSIYLKEAGFSVELAADGDVGFGKAQMLLPSVITLDIQLPKADDGWELLTRLKTDSSMASIPIVVVSIVDEPARGFSLGAVDYLLKPIDREALVRVIQRVARRGSRDQRGRSVLVIDDDPIILELMEAVLRSEGFEVLKAKDGRHGLQIVRDRKPSLVVLDLLMPEMNGFEVVDEMQGSPQTARIPIIVLTNKSLSQEEKDRLNGNIVAIRKKSEFNRENFLAQVRSLLKPEES